MRFTIAKKDPSSAARTGVLHLAHGEVETPAFMPVGTQGTVKTLSPDDLVACGAQIILSNTYHLYLRPGVELVRKAGGIQRFAAWYRPVLTDSGGYQVFSLAELRKVTQEGVRFQSHLDGSYPFFTPELVVELQRALGSDIAMVLDECTPYPCEWGYARSSMDMTVRWAERSKKRWQETTPLFSFEQSLFAIVQGSTYADLRGECCDRLVGLDFPGYAIGGVSVGEPKTALYEVTELCAQQLPPEKPRYLMGVGKPEDLIRCVAMGIDLFDCVIPTRNGRNGTVFTRRGPLVVKNATCSEDFRPIDDDCDCYACRTFSRAYIRHLFQAEEILALRLATIHNLTFYLRLMAEMRAAIAEERLEAWSRSFLAEYLSGADESEPNGRRMT
ncbi:MAG: tRNA guanosine(34) transglycosylase Tgt [bacterium]|nr:tRNA guanosine(34) transglycosylase Tgt [candidate division KSB1 bacterium]MDH7559554.1 tRNA guanosine(34) transglycosylase Tgt [bacterium]